MTSERAKRLSPGNKHEQRFYDCPGAWIGNMPEVTSQFPMCNQGHIVVDPNKAIYAVRWLGKFYTLTGSHFHDAGCGGNPGFMITFETKGKEWLTEPVLHCPLCDSTMRPGDSCPRGCVPESEAMAS